MSKCSFLVIAVFLLCGCSTQWIMTRSTAEAFSSAKYTCEAQSENKFPVKNEVAQRTKYSNHYEKCKNKKDCDGKDYTLTERPETESYVMDVNEGSRRQAFLSCMTQKGWESKIKWF